VVVDAADPRTLGNELCVVGAAAGWTVPGDRGLTGQQLDL
jgi:hypothetical protein